MKQTLTLIFTCILLPTLVAQKSLEMASNIYLEGEIALLEGKYKKAIRLFNRALDIKPDLRAAQRGVGMAYDIQKMPRKAL
ncbi:MAG: tetratricopeptide repeat protein, partial [Bacteroidota bacterium]